MKNPLEEIFDLQDQLNDRFGWSKAALMQLPEEERLGRVRQFLTVLHIETGEAALAAKARWWKQEKDWKGWDHLREELMDCTHFLISAYIATGGTAEDFHQAYVKKNQFNHTRKDWAINEQADSKVDQSSSKATT